MKECKDCNVEMIDAIRFEGEHPFQVGKDSQSKIKLHTKGKGIFNNVLDVKARYCPNCGKVELYIDTNRLVK